VKKKKHDKLVRDYDKQKEKHLEKLATQKLKDQDKNDHLRTKYINTDFLNLF
jgi:hypothetical protein